MQNDILHRFNLRLEEFVNMMIEMTNKFKNELVIASDVLNFFIHAGGDPEIPILLFYQNFIKFDERILKKDETLFDEGFVFTTLLSMINDNCNDMVMDNMIKQQINEKINEIKDKISYARREWDMLSNEKKDIIWSRIKLLLKLSEKYISISKTT